MDPAPSSSALPRFFRAVTFQRIALPFLLPRRGDFSLLIANFSRWHLPPQEVRIPAEHLEARRLVTLNVPPSLDLDEHGSLVAKALSTLRVNRPMVGVIQVDAENFDRFADFLTLLGAIRFTRRIVILAPTPLTDVQKRTLDDLVLAARYPNQFNWIVCTDLLQAATVRDLVIDVWQRRNPTIAE